jgi:hypothetical protein
MTTFTSHIEFSPASDVNRPLANRLSDTKRSRQMGHHSPGFTLTVYGHLMESLPRRQVEWIDELVFAEGFETALNLHLSGAPQGATTCSPVQSEQSPEPLENQDFAAACSEAQSSTWLGEEDSNPR